MDEHQPNMLQASEDVPQEVGLLDDVGKNLVSHFCWFSSEAGGLLTTWSFICSLGVTVWRFYYGVCTNLNHVKRFKLNPSYEYSKTFIFTVASIRRVSCRLLLLFAHRLGKLKSNWKTVLWDVINFGVTHPDVSFVPFQRGSRISMFLLI